MINLQTFYDEHPINETEILEKLVGDGVAAEAVTPEDLTRYDQDHYGGIAATEKLVSALEIEPDMHVLDLCSGMGGTSRYLAYKHGAIVTGVDLTESRVIGASRLTAMAGLADRVDYVVGDAANLEFAEGRFDRVVSQEALLHITDKEAVFAGCFRVLKAGGGLGFTDWIATEKLSEGDRKHFAEAFAAPRLVGFGDYGAMLEAAGFRGVQAANLSSEWKTILVERLEMFRSLEKETVARFGRERFDTYIRNYEFFVDRITAGALGGGRFIAWRP
jgi:cyclopropane fatty-acyl-phospholipid synthase-like methyltransferase